MAARLVTYADDLPFVDNESALAHQRIEDLVYLLIGQFPKLIQRNLNQFIEGQLAHPGCIVHMQAGSAKAAS